MVAWLVAGVVVLATWVGVASLRRRAVRRAAKTRARARAQQRMPLVSANVRGQPTRKPDIWREEAEAAARENRPT